MSRIYRQDFTNVSNKEAAINTSKSSLGVESIYTMAITFCLLICHPSLVNHLCQNHIIAQQVHHLLEKKLMEDNPPVPLRKENEFRCKNQKRNLRDQRHASLTYIMNNNWNKFSIQERLRVQEDKPSEYWKGRCRGFIWFSYDSRTPLIYP